MTSEPSPAFLFYVKDWRSSRHVQRMPYAVRGMYVEMLCEQWETGAVPSSPATCAALLGGRTAEWARAWKALMACFVPRKRDGLLVNPKLEAVRRERLKYKKSQSQSGLLGARKRWETTSKPIGSPSKPIADPNGTSVAKNGSSPSLASSSALARSGKSVGAPTDRSKRPIFKGQRLVVFAWQLDDLTRLLGTHAEAFDLRRWFYTLDAEAAGSECVIPQRDGGAWLHGQTLAEAQRRGLPIAISAARSAAVGRQTTTLATALANIDRKAAP